MPKNSESTESRRRAASDEPRKVRSPRKRVSRTAAATEETPAHNDVNTPPAEQTSEPSAIESPDERWQRIALDAYYRAERRGFAPGGELDDWLAAENQKD